MTKAIKSRFLPRVIKSLVDKRVIKWNDPGIPFTPTVSGDTITTEAGVDITTEAGDEIVTE